MKLRNLILQTEVLLEHKYQISSLSKKKQKELKERVYSKIIKESILREVDALVVRGQAVHDAILKADERLTRERRKESNFWKNFFKTHTNHDFPEIIDNSTDPEILVQLNKFAVDMKAKGYEEFDLPMNEKIGFRIIIHYGLVDLWKDPILRGSVTTLLSGLNIYYIFHMIVILKPKIFLKN